MFPTECPNCGCKEKQPRKVWHRSFVVFGKQLAGDIAFKCGYEVYVKASGLKEQTVCKKCGHKAA
jgi:hypothetical protein